MNQYSQTIQIGLRLLWILVLFYITYTWVHSIRQGLRARRLETQKQEELPDDQPPVSILVPAWNEHGTIERCVSALRQVQYPLWEGIILAGGEDGTYVDAFASTAGDDRFRVLERHPEPKNAALMRGIQAARYDILALLDADNIVEPGWLSALMAPIARGASVSVGNPFPSRITWVTLEQRMVDILTYQILKLSWIQGDRSIAIRRELLERIGGLPVHTYAREDWDIWVRLGESGERVEFAEAARLTTDRPATLEEAWRLQVRWRRTHLVGMWEHRSALLKQPVELFRQLYSYLLSIALLLFILAGLIVIILRPAFLTAILSLFTLVCVWLLGRQAAMAGAVAAYTDDWRWLKRAWMPAASLLISIPASIVALLTHTQLNPYYKGPRNNIESNPGK